MTLKVLSKFCCSFQNIYRIKAKLEIFWRAVI